MILLFANQIDTCVTNTLKLHINHLPTRDNLIKCDFTTNHVLRLLHNIYMLIVCEYFVAWLHLKSVT